MLKIILFSLKIILPAISVFLITATVNAEISVEIKDTTIKSDCVSIPIIGSTADFNGKKVEYGFEVNRVQFEILGIVPQANYALNNDAFSYSYDFTDRILTVTSEKFLSNFTGILFELNIRLLPRMDFFMDWEVFQITPKYVKIIAPNQTDTTIDFVPVAASIRIDTSSSNQTYKEEVSLNYPNPFSYETTIFFSIDEATPVKMELYNFDGGIIQKIPEDIDGALYFSFYDAFNKEIELVNNETKLVNNYQFPKGLYKVVLRINHAILATGQYRLLFETNKNKNLINLSFAN